MFSQGDQIIQQLRQYDEAKHQLRQLQSSSFSNDPEVTRQIPLAPSYTEQGENLANNGGNYTSLKILNKRPHYVPPINFAIVEDGIYRSGHPQPNNFQFLSTLKLKTIIYLGDKTDNYDYYRWIKDQEVSFKYLKMKPSVEPFMYNDENSLVSALNLIANVDNYPILIHSNKGKHRVGVFVGLMRKLLQGWCMSGIFDEYGKFAGEKGEGDLEFVEIFKPVLRIDPQKIPGFVRI
ncbi:unnamed protein product [Kuraishia capsulata CBS 1993]|uniref:Tyrosine specific protein phosphatases domain-containing protein n=1 Tax=Kuraishia capsulata CBS 1993 TaxID=1382522 RepID=W6MP62_9ASCO|nr:uncharacterized protein KUCA_T00004029001 [Kuraishia capsulata CBS 1993]CDK28048.1 unnamed protein product [Kuraishia capsulata CBS 1993]